MNLPRILPLIGVAVGGVLALKVLSGAGALPDLVAGAKAFAEGKVAAKTTDAGKPGDSSAPASSAAPVLPPGLTPSGAPAPGSPAALAAAGSAQTQSTSPALACGPDAKDLAREAGLSPAELQILQSLGARRGQLDTREQDMDVQLQLLAAAETKLDAKLKALATMKTDIQGLLTQADAQKATEIDRLVTVYSQMKPAAAAARMTLLDDSVRLPIAAKMKERALSAILGLMNPADAKIITEKLAQRYDNKAFADARSAITAAATPPAAAPNAPPAKLTGIAPPASSAPAAAAAPGAQATATPAPVAAKLKPVQTAKARPKRKRRTTSLAANAPPAGAKAASPSLASDANAAGATSTKAPPAAAPAKSG